MNLRIPRVGLLVLVAFTVASLLVLLVLSSRFGGPSVGTGSTFVLRAAVPDASGLASRSDVRVRGVLVGHVRSIDVRDGRAHLALALDAEPVDLHRGATLRIGTKTALGEAYVDLTPGPRGAPELRSGTTLAASAVRPSVEVDEALTVLDHRGRSALQRGLRTADRTFASPASADHVSGAVLRLRRTIGSFRRLGGELRGQEPDLARLVGTGGEVVSELSARQERIGRLVRASGRVLDVVADRDRALAGGLEEAPRLLETARRTLADADPLVAEARPVVRDLRAGAPDLAAAARVLPATADDAATVLRGARRLRRDAAPVLDAVPAALREAPPALRRATPALGNVTSMLRYLAPRRRTLAAWFSNTNALGINRDAKGYYARFFAFVDPASIVGLKTSLPENAYTSPGDAERNRPYAKGDFPRLVAVPPRR